MNRHHLPRRSGAPALLLAGCLLASAPAPAQEAPPDREAPPAAEAEPEFENVFIGDDSPEASTLKPRAEAQIEAAEATLEVFHDFRFEDVYQQSGITFRHRPTDDGMLHYTMVHYDHGNGVAIADVDGDDRYDIYFVSQFGGNELWRNLGNARFENVTERAGVAVDDRISVAASFADVDNDGDADLYVTTVRMGNLLFENDGSGRFRDVSEAAGLDHVGHSSAGTFFDYDRDGLLDLFLANVGVYTLDEQGREGYYVGVDDAFTGHLKPERFEGSILYRNAGDRKFVDVSRETGLVEDGWNGDATPMDFDRDGFQDLYVLNMQGDDRYWQNVEGERFVDETEEYFPRSPWGAMGVKFFDYDNNGLLDLMLTDMHSDMSEGVGPEREKLKSRMQWSDEQLQGGADNIFGNAFWEQVEQGEFREVSDEIGTENYWPWGVSVGDLNADGWDDALITSSMNYPYRYHPNSLLLNDRGEEFVETAFLLGIEPRVHGYKLRPWFPIDCSAPETQDHRICKESGIEGKVLVWGALGTRTSVIFDLDDDGDLDIVTGEFNAEPQVFVSDLSSRRSINFVKVRLTGSQSNRDGLGARVTVVAGDRRLTKVHDGKSGYLSQSRMPLYFGLGEATAIDRIEVVWPSGTEQTVDEPGPINRLIDIEEPPGESS